MTERVGPLLTAAVHGALLGARAAGTATLACSVDLGRSTTTVEVRAADWAWDGRRFPYLDACKERTIYHWVSTGFQPVSHFATSLVKLVPTEWGPPTFEIDGIKMLSTARVSPYADAERKVGLIAPYGKAILDTCGGLGYFAAWCLHGGARQVQSYEKNPAVLWLRSLNPWSPDGPGSRATGAVLTLTLADIAERIMTLPSAAFDAVLHDPPRFGTAGELYSQSFYHELARVLRHRGRLFHYTGAPNMLSSGRDLKAEVADRLRRAGFTTEPAGDGLLAVRTVRA